MGTLRAKKVGSRTLITAESGQAWLDALPDLKAAIGYCENHKDFVCRDLFDAILKSEEEHVDWLETQLDLIDKISIENYIQSQT